MYKRLTPSAIYRYKYYRLSPSKDFTRHYPREVSDASERDVYINSIELTRDDSDSERQRGGFTTSSADA